MATLKAMHSISEVVKKPLNSYVLIMCGVHLIPVLSTQSQKEKCTRPLKTNQQGEQVSKRVDVSEQFVADDIHSDFSACKNALFQRRQCLVSTELKEKNIFQRSLTNVSCNCKYKYYPSSS